MTTRFPLVAVGLAMATFLLITVLPGSGSAADRDSSFTTVAWDIDVAVQSDGSVDVRHAITVDFPEPRRGIFLDLIAAARFPTDDGEDEIRELAYTRITVAEHEHVVAHGPSVTRIRIGEEDVEVQGRITYVVGYTVTGAAYPFGDQTAVVLPLVDVRWDGAVPAVSVTSSGLEPTSATCLLGILPTGPRTACAELPADGIALAEFDGLWLDLRHPAGEVRESIGDRPAPEDVEALLPSGRGADEGGGTALLWGGAGVALIGAVAWAGRRTTSPATGGRRHTSRDTWGVADQHHHYDSYSHDSGGDVGGGDSGGDSGGGGGDW